MINKYVLLLCFGVISCQNESHTFIATNEWQVIKQDQAIPKGLHVRINLSTGLKEAKLLNEDEEKHRALSVVDSKPESKETNLDLDSLKEALKNIPNEKDYEEKIKQKFRTLEELKANMKDFDMAMKSESDIISQLLNRYKTIGEINAENIREILNILQDLEYLVHNYDDGLEFIKLKGIEIVILQNIGNHTYNDDVIIKTLELLAACTQNNKNVQRIIYSYQIGEQLLKLIDRGSNLVKTKAVYALSSLTRSYPEAQHKLIVELGHDILHRILYNLRDPDMKLKLKIVTLLHDLLTERKINRDELLNNVGFCEILPELIMYNREYFPKEHDYTEKLLKALNETLIDCKHTLCDGTCSEFKSTMNYLTEFYSGLSTDEKLSENKDDREYFTGILMLIDGITRNLNLYVKQEL